MNTVAQIQTAKTAELVAFYNLHNADKPVKKFSDRATAEKRCIDLIDSLSSKPQIELIAEADAAPEATPELPAEVAPGAPVIAAPEEKEFKIKAIHAQILHDIARSDYTPVNGREPETVNDIDYVWMNTIVETAKQKTAIEELIKAGLVTRDNGVGAQACVGLSYLGLEAYKAIPVAEAGAAPSKSAPRANASNAAGVSESWSKADVKAARLQRDMVAVTFEGKTLEFKSTRAAFTHYALPDGKHIRFRMKLKASRAEVFEYNDGKYEFKIV
jgi:hypothetical protein